jgi:hypothetical protein
MRNKDGYVLGAVLRFTTYAHVYKMNKMRERHNHGTTKLDMFFWHQYKRDIQKEWIMDEMNPSIHPVLFLFIVFYYANIKQNYI